MTAQSRHITKDMIVTVPNSLEFLLKSVQDQYHVSLLDHCRLSPTMLIFLRHFGCCFSKEALSDIHTVLPEIRSLGTRIVLVHMASDEEASTILAGYGLADIPRISSPDQGLYRSFGLGRATLEQLFSPEIWTRGLAALSHGHALGGSTGDILQMPGVFLIHNGKILKSFCHKSPGERLDYLAMAFCEAKETVGT